MQELSGAQSETVLSDFIERAACMRHGTEIAGELPRVRAL